MSAYHNMAEPTAIVITGVTPVAFLGKEHKAIYKRKREASRQVVAQEER